MERAATCARAELIAQLLRTSGLAEGQANEVGWSCVIDYPLARRRGVAVVAHDLARRGLAPASADEAAATLLAWELADAGVPLAAVLAELGRRGLPDDVTTGAAYEGVRLHRLHRRLGAHEPASEPERDPLAARLWAVLFLALAAVAVLVLL